MSVLKWEFDELGNGCAHTAWGDVRAEWSPTHERWVVRFDDGERQDCNKGIGRDVALAVADDLYTARCTELLPLVKPGQVAVDESLLREVQVFLREQIDRWGAGPFAEGSAQIERNLLPRITAAIDAAKEGGK